MQRLFGKSLPLRCRNATPSVSSAPVRNGYRLLQHGDCFLGLTVGDERESKKPEGSQIEECVDLARSFTPLNQAQMAALEAKVERVAKQALFFRLMPR